MTSPFEHFSEFGRDALATRASILSTADMPCEEDYEGRPHEDYIRDCRLSIDATILDLLRGDSKPTRRAGTPPDTPHLCGVRLDWHHSLPKLACWAGRATMMSG